MVVVVVVVVVVVAVADVIDAAEATRTSTVPTCLRLFILLFSYHFSYSFVHAFVRSFICASNFWCNIAAATTKDQHNKRSNSRDNRTKHLQHQECHSNIQISFYCYHHYYYYYYYCCSAGSSRPCWRLETMGSMRKRRDVRISCRTMSTIRHSWQSI